MLFFPRETKTFTRCKPWVGYYGLNYENNSISGKFKFAIALSDKMIPCETCDHSELFLIQSAMADCSREHMMGIHNPKHTI